MSDIDLTQAVEAAARDRAERQNGPDSWESLDGYAKYMWREGVYREVRAAIDKSRKLRCRQLNCGGTVEAKDSRLAATSHGEFLASVEEPILTGSRFDQASNNGRRCREGV